MIPIADSARDRRVPFLTLALLLVNGLVFFYQLALTPRQLDALIMHWGVVPLRQTWALDTAPAAFDLWLVPLFTSMFMHGGWAHIIGNALFLWTFGPAVEQYLGRGRFLVLYLAAGLVAAQAQVFVDPLSRVPMIGASGAIAGVLGAYIFLFPMARILVLLPVFFIPLFFEVPALFFLGLWFVEQFLIGTVAALSPTAGQAAGVAWWAHVGGFVAGVVLIGLFGGRHHKHDGRRRRDLGHGHGVPLRRSPRRHLPPAYHPPQWWR